MKELFKIILIVSGFFYYSTWIIADENSDTTTDNSYYITAIKQIEDAKKYIEAGEYDKGYELSEHAKTNLKNAELYDTLKIYLTNLDSLYETVKTNLNNANQSGLKNDPITITMLSNADNSMINADDLLLQQKNETDLTVRYKIVSDAIEQLNSISAILKTAENTAIANKENADNLFIQFTALKEEMINTGLIIVDDDDDDNLQMLINKGLDLYKLENYSTCITQYQLAYNLLNEISLKENEIQTDPEKREARRILNRAKVKMNETRNIEDEILSKEDLTLAESYLNQAIDFFNNNNCPESIKKSIDSIRLLNNLKFVQNDISGPVYPKYYKIILNLDNRDTLWKIAQYSFVYNDPLKWEILYEANKDRLKFPKNPHLILPEKLIVIPSINGEIREGVYQNGQSYPVFPSLIKNPE